MGIDTFVPEVRQLLVAGKTVACPPLRVRQIPAFTRAVAPILTPLLAGNWLSAVCEGGDELLRAVAIATGEPPEWLGELMPDELITLVAAVVEVNADFFVRRVLPTLNAAAATVQTTLAAMPGTMPSPSSAPTDTASPASSSTA